MPLTFDALESAGSGPWLRLPAGAWAPGETPLQIGCSTLRVLRLSHKSNHLALPIS